MLGRGYGGQRGSFRNLQSPSGEEFPLSQQDLIFNFILAFVAAVIIVALSGLCE